MKDPRDIIIRPIITEKAMDFRDIFQYAFEVSMYAPKPEIKKAVEELFKVHVIKVRTTTVKPKNKRVRRAPGKTRMWKKALVTLKKGETIPMFEGV